VVTVSCAGGALGMVYGAGADGKTSCVKYHKVETDLSNLQKPKDTKIQVILASPDLAFKVSRMAAIDGVGLARMEFIINNHIRVHPLAALYPGRVSDFRQGGRGSGVGWGGRTSFISSFLCLFTSFFFSALLAMSVLFGVAT